MKTMIRNMINGHTATRPHGHTATRPHGHTATRPHGHTATKKLTLKALLLASFFLGLNNLHAATIEWDSGTREWTYTDRLTGGFPGKGWLAGTADGGSGTGNTESLYIDTELNVSGSYLYFLFGQTNGTKSSDFDFFLPNSFNVIGAVLDNTRTTGNQGGGIFHFSSVAFLLDQSVIDLNGQILNHRFDLESSPRGDGILVSARSISSSSVPDSGSTFAILALSFLGLVGLCRRFAK